MRRMREKAWYTGGRVSREWNKLDSKVNEAKGRNKEGDNAPRRCGEAAGW